MDFPTLLNYCKWTYLSTKFVQLLYQLSFLFYLIGDHKEGEVSIMIACGSTVIGVLLSVAILHSISERLFRPDGNYSDYIHLIVLEFIVFIFALITYPIAIVNIKSNYENKKEELYFLTHSKALLELRVNEIKRNPRNIYEETINEEIETIETTTEHLVDKALNTVRNGLISLMSTETPSDIMVTPQSDPKQQVFEENYDCYVNVNLSLSMISIIIQIIIVCSLVISEYAKYKIRANVQPEMEMQERGGDAAGGSAEDGIALGEDAFS